MQTHTRCARPIPTTILPPQVGPVDGAVGRRRHLSLVDHFRVRWGLVPLKSSVNAGTPHTLHAIIDVDDDVAIVGLRAEGQEGVLITGTITTYTNSDSLL